MWTGIVSLFPEMFDAVTGYGITARAIRQGLLELDFWNPRDFAHDRHRTVDDKPYGGGPGMLMKVQPLRDAIGAARAVGGGDCKVIYLSPQGRRINQQVLGELAQRERLIMVAGRYEGIDERLIGTDIDEEYSIGDYVLSGGELAAMVLIDGLTRLLPGAVGDPESVQRDSFCEGLLDYPQYTRPDVVDDMAVPEVLLGGDHQAIARWRHKMSLGRTFEKRPDLLAGRDLTETQRQLLDEYCREHRIPVGHDEDNDK